MVNTNNIGSTLAQRDALVGYAVDPSALGRVETQLFVDGGLLTGEPDINNYPTDVNLAKVADDANALVAKLNQTGRPGWQTFAGQKLMAASKGLTWSGDQVTFAGGICTLSPYESGLLRDGPGVGDRETYVNQNLGPVPVTQVFEAIGQTAVGRSVVVLEDELWGSKVATLLGLCDEAGKERTAEAAKNRNDRAMAVTQRLRQLLLPGAEPIQVVRDSEVMADLRESTDEFLGQLGLPVDLNDTYRYVYAGMYSSVWAGVLERAGYLPPNDTLVIYEPTKHFTTVSGRYGGSGEPGSREVPEMRFRGQMLAQAPFGVTGSANESVGLIGYVEPLLPNGRRFSNVMSPDTMPNSSNYQDFDFGRFPLPSFVPGGDTMTSKVWRRGQQYQYLDTTGDTVLNRNPAFLWGTFYPPTPQLAERLQKMVKIAADCRSTSRLRTEGLAPAERKAVSAEIRARSSAEMAEVASTVIAELERITRAMFKEES